MTALTDIRTDVAGRAADVEGGRTDVRATLRALGDAGLLGPGADDDDATGGLATAVRVVRAIAAESLAKVAGQPFRVAEIRARIDALLGEEA